MMKTKDARVSHKNEMGFSKVLSFMKASDEDNTEKD